MISVLITDYLQPEFTKMCIKSLKNCTYKDLEILVRDNSRDNIGLAASSNELARKARGEYLFFLNNDTLVKRDIFEHLLTAPFDVVGCRMFDYQGKNELSSAVSVDKFGCPAARTGRIFYPDGAIFIRKNVFEDIGGFDEKLFLFGEDRDLCWRAFLAGYSVGLRYRAVFYHASRSVDSTNFFRRFHSEKNILRSMLKNYTLASLAKILPQYIFWLTLELGLVSLIKPQAIFKSYLPAFWWNIKNLGDTLKKRKEIKRRIPDSRVPFSKVVGKFWVLRNNKMPRWEC